MSGKRRAKGAGYLITNADDSKTLIASLTDPITGKIKKIQVTAPTETACLKRMKKKLDEYEKKHGQVSSNAKMTVTELCRSLLNTQYQQGLIKRTSKDRNDVTIRNQIENSPLGHIQIHNVNSKDIDNLFSALFEAGKLSVSSIEKVKYILDAAFKWAVGRGDMNINPIDRIRSNLDKKFEKLKSTGADDEDVKVLNEEEEALFLATANKTNKDGSYKYPGGLHGQFLLKSGPRIGEYISLRWKDYNFESHILKIEKSTHPVKADDNESAETNYISIEGDTKNKKARNIELRDDAISVIEEIYALTPWKKPSDYIALTKNGKPYTATEMEHIVDTVYRNAGISENVSGLHILRRTFATRLFREGYTVKEVAAYLGDEEATVSRYYIAARETRKVDGKRIAVVSLKRNDK